MGNISDIRNIGDTGPNNMRYIIPQYNSFHILGMMIKRGGFTS